MDLPSSQIVTSARYLGFQIGRDSEHHQHQLLSQQLQIRMTAIKGLHGSLSGTLATCQTLLHSLYPFHLFAHSPSETLIRTHNQLALRLLG
eukprot:12914021-Prorocentrum_lima.AAC.1